MSPCIEIEYMEINNYLRWGELVILWAVNPGIRPASIHALRNLLKETGIGTIPDRYEHLQFVQSNADSQTVTLKIPPKTLFVMLPEVDVLKSSLCILEQEDPNPFPGLLPQFYLTNFGAHDINECTPIPKRIALFYKRIGDYTSANCLTYDSEEIPQSFSPINHVEIIVEYDETDGCGSDRN